jgi:hypothetical protein
MLVFDVLQSFHAYAIVHDGPGLSRCSAQADETPACNAPGQLPSQPPSWVCVSFYMVRQVHARSHAAHSHASIPPPPPPALTRKTLAQRPPQQSLNTLLTCNAPSITAHRAISIGKRGYCVRGCIQVFGKISGKDAARCNTVLTWPRHTHESVWACPGHYSTTLQALAQATLCKQQVPRARAGTLAPLASEPAPLTPPTHHTARPSSSSACSGSPAKELPNLQPQGCWQAARQHGRAA